MEREPVVPWSESGGLDNSTRPKVSLVRDQQTCIPLDRLLSEEDILVILTPVAVPDTSSTPESQGTDPFEVFGRALAKHHPKIRHIPYLARYGITSTHVPFIKAAKVVIFIISGPYGQGQMDQTQLAEVALSIGGETPQIIMACCNIQEVSLSEATFPTVVHVSGYSRPELELAASFLFGDVQPEAGSGSHLQNPIMEPRAWEVTVWRGAEDLAAVHELWHQCLPDRYGIQIHVLQSLLCTKEEDGYARHYVVREPGSGIVLGFCATYTSWVNSSSDNLIASLALIIVRANYRGRGIGRSLHDLALKELKKTRGVCRLQLGSTFPRLLYGLPMDLPDSDWFGRRGWQMGTSSPGSGQEVCDWILKFDDWPSSGKVPAELLFRQCEAGFEFERVLEIANQEWTRSGNIGWYDEYTKLAAAPQVHDIVLALERNEIVAMAITYVPKTRSPIAEDVPWAGTIGDDVGGVTCICITDDRQGISNNRDTIMIRLLDACLRALKSQGMKRMFIDGVRGGYEGFQAIGKLHCLMKREIGDEGPPNPPYSNNS